MQAQNTRFQARGLRAVARKPAAGEHKDDNGSIWYLSKGAPSAAVSLPYSPPPFVNGLSILRRPIKSRHRFLPRRSPGHTAARPPWKRPLLESSALVKYGEENPSHPPSTGESPEATAHGAFGTSGWAIAAG